MSIRFLQIKNAPIIISEFYGENTFSEFDATFQHVEKILRKRDEPKLFWLIDMLQMQLSYRNMIRVLETANNKGFLTNSASRLIPIPVGKYDLYRIFREVAYDRYPHIRIPFFTELDDAWYFLKYLTDA